MLAVLLVLAAALIALEGARPWVPPQTARRIGAGVCLLGALVACASLASLAGSRLGFTGVAAELDALSAWMVVALLAASGAGLLAGEGRSSLVGAALLTLLAGSAALFVLGLAGLAALSRPRRPAVPVWALCSGLAIITLTVHAGPGFDSMRALPPEGVLAAFVLLLALVGLAALFAAVLRGQAPPWLVWLGTALVARITLDLCGPATPVWWGALVAALGLAAATVAAWLACLRSESTAILAAAAVSASGLACTGLGIALAGRGADLPLLASAGLEAALLLVLAQSGSVALLGLCLHTADERVRLAASCAAAASLTALPPFAGFAGVLLLLHALFAACRIGGAWMQIGCACAVAAVGLAAGLMSVAAVRGLAFGLFQHTGASAATDPEVKLGIAALGGLGLLLAISPGLALLAAAPALAGLVAAKPTENLLFAPAIVAVSLGLVSAAVAWFAHSGQERRRVPAWNGGATASARLDAYAPQRLAVRLPRIEARAPTLREWLGAAAVALAVAIIVLAAR